MTEYVIMGIWGSMAMGLILLAVHALIYGLNLVNIGWAARWVDKRRAWSAREKILSYSVDVPCMVISVGLMFAATSAINDGFVVMWFFIVSALALSIFAISVSHTRELAKRRLSSKSHRS